MSPNSVNHVPERNSSATSVCLHDPPGAFLYWLCNRTPAEFQARPERATFAAIETRPFPGRNDGDPEPWIGHDPTKPQAITAVWLLNAEGKLMSPSIFGASHYGARPSGAYGEISIGEIDPRITAIRVEVATELERIEVPFEFRDIPLSERPPAKY
jgi:hypothetical protein